MASLETLGGIHYEMMKRCYNENSIMYNSYGAKGITVCSEWHNKENFKKWALENGYKKGLRLERINANGNYCPSNCCFGKNYKYKTGTSKKTKQIHDERIKLKLENNIPDNYLNLRIYRIWSSMKQRCYNPKDDHYYNYGGRGIKICNEWSKKYGFFSFYNWAMKNGYNDNLSIDRIDNNKDYSPENCRWATMSKQIENRRISRKYIFKGNEMWLPDIAKEAGVKYGMLYSRVVLKNMTIEYAINDILSK